MWTKWPRYIFFTTWILFQVLCAVVCGLRHKTACYNFLLIVDPPCGATQMLLPTMFTLGVSSDVTCHSEITAGTSLRGKGVDEITRCCQQRENDSVTEYCLPAMKNQLRDQNYLDFVNTCTASSRCQMSSPVQHTGGEDYVTFTFDCVHKDTVLHIQLNSTHTGQEVYLYNDQHDGEAHANCIAYSHECDSHVVIQLAATHVVSTACNVTFTDGDVSINKMDCKNPPASSNCSSTMFESKSNYVNMSIFMTVDPGSQEKEFLWIRVKADTGKNVTVVCGANIPSDVSLNCPTSTSTTTTTTTMTAASTTTIKQTHVASNANPTQKTVVVTTGTSTTTTTTTTTAAAASTTTSKQTPVRTQNPVVVTPSTGYLQVMVSTTTTLSGTSKRNNGATTLSVSGNGVSPSTTPHHSKQNSTSTHPPQNPSGTSSETFIIGGSVGGAVLIAVIVTTTVCVRRRKSSKKTDQKREIMDESQENGYSAGKSVDEDGYVPNPVYEATDDYKMEQLHRKSGGDEGYGQEDLSPYAVSRPAIGDSEEKSNVQVSDLYSKVNKPQGTDQVTDVYTKVSKCKKTGSNADGGEEDDISAMYAKVQK